MAKIEFLMKWPPWQNTSAIHGQTWMRSAPTQMIEWCLCNTAAVTALWASVDLDGFVERTALGDGFSRDSRRGSKAGGKRQLARCSYKTQDKFAIASMAKKLLHRCTGAHARVHMHFCGEYAYIHRCCAHHACAGVYVRQMLWTSAYTFASRSLQDVHMRLRVCSLFHLALGNENGI